MDGEYEARLDGHRRAVGRVAIGSANVELALGLLVGGLLGRDRQTAEIVVGDAGVQWLITKLRAAAERVVPAEHRDAVVTVARRAEGLFARRGQVIHAAWGGFEAGADVLRVKVTTRKGRETAIPMATAEVDALADEFNTLMGEALVLVGELAAVGVVGPWVSGPGDG